MTSLIIVSLLLWFVWAVEYLVWLWAAPVVRLPWWRLVVEAAVLLVAWLLWLGLGWLAAGLGLVLLNAGAGLVLVKHLVHAWMLRGGRHG